MGSLLLWALVSALLYGGYKFFALQFEWTWPETVLYAAHGRDGFQVTLGLVVVVLLIGLAYKLTMNVKG